MATREEIRSGLEDILEECVDDYYKTLHPIKEICRRIQEYEVSQGVVLKVRWKLPKHWLDKYEDGYTEECYFPKGLYESLEQAGYAAVKPLIKEE